MQRQRAPHLGRRHPGRARDRVGHHAGERALAQVAEQQPHEQLLLGRGRAREQRLHRARAARRPSPGPRARRSRRTPARPRATVSDASAAGAGRSRSSAQPTPIWRWVSSPDSQLTTGATSSVARPRQQRGEQRDLLVARRRRRDRGRRLDELGKPHPTKHLAVCERTALARLGGREQKPITS